MNRQEEGVDQSQKTILLDTHMGNGNEIPREEKCPVLVLMQ
jgi:hypothetical protein